MSSTIRGGRCTKFLLYTPDNSFQIELYECLCSFLFDKTVPIIGVVVLVVIVDVVVVITLVVVIVVIVVAVVAVVVVSVVVVALVAEVVVTIL